MTNPKLVTLLDMLKKYSTIFGDLMVALFDMEMASSYLDDDEKEEKIDKNKSEYLSHYLTIATNMASELNLDASTVLLERIWKAHKSGYKRGDLHDDIKDLRSRIEDQLKSRLFLFVDQNRASLYKQPQLFGQQVNDNFPCAIDDIQDAGTCLALGQGTACVMHLMRVMEVGLKALAKGLKIPYAPSWESYLKQIEAKIAEKHPTKDAKWKKVEKFYRDISGDLMTIKQAWRNPTMHIERRYSPDEAEQIFMSVKALMQRMAKKAVEQADALIAELNK